MNTVTRPAKFELQDTADEPTVELSLTKGTRVLGRFSIEELLEEHEGHWRLYLADDIERGEFALLVAALSEEALHSCLSGPAAGEVLTQTTFGTWQIAAVMLSEPHVQRFKSKMLARPSGSTIPTLQSPSAPAAPRLCEGSLFADRYRVGAVLGRGGAGEVYRAWDETFQRHVALKIVHMRASQSPLEHDDAKRRLLKEARFVSVLRHPNIVEVHDAGESQGLPYLALEICEGGSLRKAIAEGQSSETDRQR